MASHEEALDESQFTISGPSSTGQKTRRSNLLSATEGFLKSIPEPEQWDGKLAEILGGQKDRCKIRSAFQATVGFPRAGGLGINYDLYSTEDLIRIALNHAAKTKAALERAEIQINCTIPAPSGGVRGRRVSNINYVDKAIG